MGNISSAKMRYRENIVVKHLPGPTVHVGITAITGIIILVPSNSTWLNPGQVLVPVYRHDALAPATTDVTSGLHFHFTKRVFR